MTSFSETVEKKLKSSGVMWPILFMAVKLIRNAVMQVNERHKLNNRASKSVLDFCEYDKVTGAFFSAILLDSSSYHSLISLSFLSMSVSCCCLEMSFCMRRCRSLSVRKLDFNHPALLENLSVDIVFPFDSCCPTWLHGPDAAWWIFVTLPLYSCECLPLPLPHNLRLTGA